MLWKRCFQIRKFTVPLQQQRWPVHQVLLLPLQRQLWPVHQVLFLPLQRQPWPVQVLLQPLRHQPQKNWKQVIRLLFNAYITLCVGFVRVKAVHVLQQLPAKGIETSNIEIGICLCWEISRVARCVLKNIAFNDWSKLGVKSWCTVVEKGSRSRPKRSKYVMW